VQADTVISRILARVDASMDAAALDEATAEGADPALVAGARAAFGSWAAAVAATLVHLRAFYERIARNNADDDAPAGPADDPWPERVVGPDSDVDAWALLDGQRAALVALPHLGARAEPWLDHPDGAGEEGDLRRLVLSGGDTGLILVTASGAAVALDQRLLPPWDGGPPGRALAHRFEGLEHGDPVVAALPRSSFRAAPRYYTLSSSGNLKASDTAELRKLGTEAMAAALVRDDVIVDAFAGPVDAPIFVASSHGKAIVFESGEIRSQGRKATGVRAIALDPDATAVGGFVVQPGAWIVLAMRSGLLKRTRVNEYRPQGRAGGGLQSVRLSPDDRVVAVGQGRLGDDLVVITSAGRWGRFPLWCVPPAGRAGRGERVLAIEDGETITAVAAAPAGPLD
jgi:hypothetical protein